LSFVFLFLAAALGGALNSVAGGGSFISFPSLLFAGITPVVANATNSVALWPAAVASAIAYRRELDVPKPVFVALAVASLAGGLGGALLLLRTPDSTFVKQLPWLLFAATMLFTLGPTLSKRLKLGGGGHSRAALGATMLAQLVIAIYGGYFGGGMGILMLAAMSLIGMTKIHTMNGLKSILGVLINGIAVVAFVVSGAVAWEPGIVMVAGGMLGGYGGASVARRVDPRWVRLFVSAVAWAMTVYFFVRAYRGGK
jgi:uncharacterized protein